MFTFSDPNPQILERNILWGDAEEKYPDKFMIVINTNIKDAYLYGDIVAILTPNEYSSLIMPETPSFKYSVWKGIELIKGGLGVLGFYM